MDPNYCKSVLLGLTNGHFLVPFVDSYSFKKEVSFAVLDEDLLNCLILSGERSVSDHNEFLLGNAKNIITCGVHHPDSVNGGICFTRVSCY